MEKEFEIPESPETAETPETADTPETEETAETAREVTETVETAPEATETPETAETAETAPEEAEASPEASQADEAAQAPESAETADASKAAEEAKNGPDIERTAPFARVQNAGPEIQNTIPFAAVKDDPNLQETARFSVVKKPPEVGRKAPGASGDVIDAPGEKKRKKREKRENPTWEAVKKVWWQISPLLAAIASVVIVCFLLKTGGEYVYKRYVMPVDPEDPTPIVVEIPRGSGASAIAKILYEAGGESGTGLIRNKAIFKVYVDFKGKSSGLKAGTYVLSRNMGIKQIVDIICTGNPPRETVKFTMSEGMTVEAIGAKLVDLGILESADRFLALCRTGEDFAGSYWFIKNLVDEGRPGRLYMLEGYLFPDTYEVFADATEEEIIVKMLDRFNDIYARKYAERAEELSLTLDEVVILASMIEKEAKTFDFAKVSAVFHGRLAIDMALGSDATLGYVLHTTAIEFSQEELDTDSPYNTYKYKGLPAGPISNPGLAAIEAVLYPDEQYIEDGYLYFCLMDSSTGALIFARTLEEHEANVAKYKPNW